MSQDETTRPSALNLFACKCPRCRKGDMFINKKPYSKGFMRMHETCPVCGEYFDKEVGFFYGSSYVSYLLAVLISAVTFILWWVILGFSVDDNRVFYWLGINAALLMALQPPLMRLARTLWLAFFVPYDKDWNHHPAVRPQNLNAAMKNAW